MPHFEFVSLRRRGATGFVGLISFVRLFVAMKWI